MTLTNRARAGLPFGLLAPWAVGGGLLASASFAPVGWWPAGIVAVAALTWAIARARSLGAAIGLGWVFGLVFMAISLVWQTEILILSYTGLTVVTSLTYALIAGLTRLSWRLPGAPVWAAAAWSVGEWSIATLPFDGFGWMRLGYGQVDGPLAGFYPFVGAATVSFLVALLGSLLAWATLTRTGRRALVATLAIVGVLGAGWWGTTWNPEPVRTGDDFNVGWAQGGAPGGGIYGLGEARTITYNSLAQTRALAADAASGTLPAPDFVVWPENSTDLDVRTDAPTRLAVEAAVASMGVPILVGTLYTDSAREERQTVSVWWTADGPGPMYAKRDLVPFGEWIPFRSVLLPLVPELAYVGYQSVPGTGPGALDVTVAGGRPLTLGVAICYEVIFPETMYQAVDAGAEIMVVVSSNAMYQGTNQIDQQFAITRVRAAEMRREVLVVTTSGVSGLIGPDGTVEMRAPSSVGAHGVQTMTPTIHRTPAMVVGAPLELALVVLGVLAAAAGAWRRRSEGVSGDNPARRDGGVPSEDGTMEGMPRSREGQ